MSNFPTRPLREDPPTDAATYGPRQQVSLPAPGLFVHAEPETGIPYLTAGEQEWLTHAGINLNDLRIHLVTADDGAYGFDVAGELGPAQVRFDVSAVMVPAELRGDLLVLESSFGGPDGWLPWHIPSGPATVLGARYQDVGAAVRAALTGVPVDDPRVRLVTAEDGAYGFDIDVVGGTAQVRFDATAIALDEAAWNPDGTVAFPAEGAIGPENWKPWFIPAGPATVAGHRYDDAGAAIQATLNPGLKGPR